jgi:glucose-1-phosphate adenylyltransferase
MDLLGDTPNFQVDDKSWVIRSRNPIEPPHYISDNARVVNSAIISGCEIYGTVENSVLSHNVEVEEGAIVKDSIIFSGVKIKKGAVVINSIIAENAVIEENAKVGEVTNDRLIAVIGGDVCVGKNKVVEAGAMVEKDV